MKKIVFSATVWMMALTISAQPGMGQRPMMQDRMEAQRVAYITQKLDLTSSEAAIFWPIYNEYRNKQQELRRANFPERGPQNLSDADAEKAIEKHLAMEEQLLQLKREYYGKLRSVISPGKLVRLMPAEMEFNRSVLERVRERMGQRD